MLLPDDNERIKAVINLFCEGKELLFSKQIGVSQPRINRLFNVDNRSNKIPLPSYDIIKAILKTFPQISSDWLILGKGEMLCAKENVDSLPQSTAADSEEEYDLSAANFVPLYRLSSFSSLSNLLYENSSESKDHPICIPLSPFSDGALLLSGSLAKSASKGDIVMYQKLEPQLENIIFGESYLISLQMGTEEYLRIGYIFPSENPNYISLSDTPTGEHSQLFPIDRIKALALIRTTISFHQLR